MKKFALFVFGGIFFFLIHIGGISASELKTNMIVPSQIEPGDTFTVKISVTVDDIWAVRMKLDYDQTKLQLIGTEGQAGFKATVGNKIILDSDRGHSGTFDVISLKFKALSSLTRGESTSISILDIEGANPGQLIQGTNVSKTISVNPLEPEIPFVKGDVTKDGKVLMNDVILALRMYLKVEPITDERLSRGDINSDGKIMMNDIIYILRIYLKLETNS